MYELNVNNIFFVQILSKVSKKNVSIYVIHFLSHVQCKYFFRLFKVCRHYVKVLYMYLYYIITAYLSFLQ